MILIRNLRHITESACLVSLSILLSKITLFHMPFGGSLALANNLPLVLLSYRCGYKVGFFASLVYSFVRMVFSFTPPLAKNFVSFVLLILLDYLLPNIVMGMSSLFAIRIHNRYFKLYSGIIISYILKILISTTSGVVLWGAYIPFECNLWIYSLLYNSLYIVPDSIITIVLIGLVIKFFDAV